jgi:hypothetical protein
MGFCGKNLGGIVNNSDWGLIDETIIHNAGNIATTRAVISKQ